MSDSTEIDFAKVDWNNLTHEDFQKLSNKMSERQKLSKTTKPKKTGSSVIHKTVEIMNKNYSIPESLYLRIKNCKNEATKQKLINEVLTTIQPVTEL